MEMKRTVTLNPPYKIKAEHGTGPYKREGLLNGMIGNATTSFGRKDTDLLPVVFWLSCRK